MKKFIYLIFAFASVLFIISISLLGFGNTQIKGLPNNNTTNAEELNLSLTVESEVNLVEGQTKQFFVQFSPEGEYAFSLSEQNIVFIDENFVVHALNVGQVVCTSTLSYKEEIITKTTTIIVAEKNIIFTALTTEDFSGYKSGLKANSSYQNYTLNVTSNYDLSHLSFHADEQVCITSINLFAQGKSANISFYVTEQGEFKFVVDGFVYNSVATNYISDLQLQFEQEEVFENDTLTLYSLNENKNIAYQDEIFDFANVVNQLTNFDVEIQNENVLSFSSNSFIALSQGQTNVIFYALDGSNFSKTINVVVEDVIATTCDILSEENIEVYAGQFINIAYSNFYPVYSTVKNLCVKTTSNLSVSNCLKYIYANQTGNGKADIFLNDVLIKSINISVLQEEIEPINNEFSLFLVSANCTIDNQNKTITFSACSESDIRVYLLDSEGKSITITTQIEINFSGNSLISVEGKVIHIGVIDSGCLTISLNDMEFEYQIILL